MRAQLATISLSRPRVVEGAVMAAILLASVAAGVTLVARPALALAPIAVLVSVLLLVDGRARIVFVLFGGVLVFQQTESLDTSKIGFLALFAVAFVGAAVNVRTMWNTSPYRVARPLLAASTAMVALAALSLAVAHNNDIPLMGAWLRDIAPHLLFASVPIFALDAQASLGRRGLVTLLVSVGVLGALAFAVQWLDRRGIAHLYASRLGLASHFVPAALFAYGMSATLHAARTKWLALSGLVLALLLATGTRATLALLAAPLAIALGARTHLARRSLRLVVLGPIAAVITYGLILAVLRVSDADERYFNERVAIFRSSGTESDNSYTERLRQTRAAWEVFESNPIVGSGAGTSFEWQTVGAGQWSGFLIDTPLSFLAKFGLLGLIALAFIVRKYWLFTKSVSRRDPTVAQLALVGYLAVVAASTVFSSQFENKGFSFGLILVLALVLGEADRCGATRERRTPTGPASQGYSG